MRRRTELERAGKGRRGRTGAPLRLRCQGAGRRCARLANAVGYTHKYLNLPKPARLACLLEADRKRARKGERGGTATKLTNETD